MLKVERQTLKKVAGPSPHAYVRVKSSISEIFHENTKLTPTSSVAYGQAIAQILRSDKARRLMNNPYKVYTLMDQVDMPAPRIESDVERALVERRSMRELSGEPLSLAQLSHLLRFSYGRTSPGGQFRPVPSAGALYPLEMYVLVRHVDDLEPGVYHYNVDRHSLDVVRRGDVWDEVKSSVNLSDMADPDSASLMICVTAIFRRCTMKYSDRGYRLILMEAGEVGQSLSLLATSTGLACYMQGAFIDNQLSTVLGIDGYDEAPLLPMIFGHPLAVEKG
ncbi:MAG: SagB/ThcOx family dehydrogenase [Acidobacteriota bacterium]